MPKKIIVFLLLFFPIQAFSKVDTLSSPIDPNNQILRTYSKGRIITSNYDRIDAEDVIIYKNSVAFKNKITRNVQRMDFKDISLINVKAGNYLLEGTLLGALGGLVLPFSVIREDSKLSSDVFIYSTLIFAGIGAIIGLALDDNDTIFQSGNLYISLQNKNYILLNKKEPELAINFYLRIY